MTTAWPTLALEELASVQRGKFSARPRNDPRYYGGEIPFIQTGDVANGAGRVRSYSQTLNADGLSVSKLFPKGSLVVTIAANIGDVAEVAFDFACPDSLVVVQANEGTDSKWLQYSLESKKALLDSLAPQNAQKNINLEVLRRLPLDVPPLEEQKRIAGGIKTWDTAIETTERLIAAKERRHRALLVLLLGKRLWSESSHERADSLFNSISERNRPDLPVLAVTQDQGVVPRATLDRRITMELSDPATFKVVRRDDFVISLRSFQGGLEHSAYDGLVSPAYTVLRCGPALLPRFYRHYLKSPDFLKRLSVAVVGIRDGKQINFADFASLKLPLPNFERQQAIAAVLDESEKEIDLLGQSLDALKRQKRGLMQKLLTGEWRVPLPDTESTVKETAPC